MLWRFPARVARFRNGDLPETLTSLDKLLLAGLISQHRGAGTIEELAVLFDAFWQADSATEYHRRVADRFGSVFLRHHSARIHKALGEAMTLAPARRVGLCEIGCGSGLVLNWFREQFPHIEQFIAYTTETGKRIMRFDIVEHRQLDDLVRIEGGELIDRN